MTEHVYDSPTGKYLLIPQGSKLIGVYDSGLETTSWIVALAMLRAPSWAPYPGIYRAHRDRKRLHSILESLIIEARQAPG